MSAHHLRSERPVATGRFGLDRFKAFSDGLLAIAITILVLTVEPPEGYDFENRGVGPFLLLLEGKLRFYIASFVLVATYWVQNVVICSYARYATRPFLWIGMLFLLAVTLVPFGVALHGQYPTEEFVIGVFGAIHLSCLALLLVQWRYVAARCREGAPPVDERTRSSLSLRLMAAMGLVALSVVVSMWSLRAGSVLFLTVPLLFLSHRLADSGLDPETPAADG